MPPKILLSKLLPIQKGRSVLAGLMLNSGVKKATLPIKDPVLNIGQGPQQIISTAPIKTTPLVDPFVPSGKTSYEIVHLLERPTTPFKQQENWQLPRGERNQPVHSFISELDWSPEGWFGERVILSGPKWDETDVLELGKHLPDYKRIEAMSKKDGSWLKLANGETWSGDPRDWVLMKEDKRWANPVNTYEVPNNAQTGMRESLARSFILSRPETWQATNPKVWSAFGLNKYISVDGKRVPEFDALVKEAEKYDRELQNLGDEYNEVVEQLYGTDLIWGEGFDERYPMPEEWKRKFEVARRNSVEAWNKVNSYDTLSRFEKEQQHINGQHFGVFPPYGTKILVDENPGTQLRHWDSIQIQDPEHFDMTPHISDWDHIEYPRWSEEGIPYTYTDQIVRHAQNNGYGAVVLKGVREGGMDHEDLTDKNDDFIIVPGYHRVSYHGNNGALDGTTGPYSLIYRKQGGTLKRI